MTELELTAEPTNEAITALVAIKSAMPMILAADENDILGKLRAEIKDFEPDMSTKKGREAIRSMAFKPRKAKAEFKRLAETMMEGAKKTIETTRSELKVIEGRLDGLSDELRRPLDELEAIEKARDDANEAAIQALEVLADGLTDLTPAEILARHESIVQFDWALEFKARGERVHAGVVARLQVAFVVAKVRVAAAHLEIVRLAAEAEARRVAEIEERRLHDERIAAEAAAEATREAEAKAEREAKLAAEEAQRVLQAERDAAALKAQAERDAVAETQRKAREAFEEFQRKAEDDRIAAENASREAQEAVERKAEAERKAIKAKALAETQEAERQARESREIAARAHQAEIDAKAREESARVMAEANARQAKIDAAKAVADGIAAERKRVEAERAAAEAKQKLIDDAAALKAANIAHQTKINGEVLADLMKILDTLPLANAKEIVKALARGQVRHCKIGYGA